MRIEIMQLWIEATQTQNEISIYADAIWNNAGENRSAMYADAKRDYKTMYYKYFVKYGLRMGIKTPTLIAGSRNLYRIKHLSIQD